MSGRTGKSVRDLHFAIRLSILTTWLLLPIVGADYKPTPEEEAAVKTVLRAYADASRNYEADTLPAIFAEDADIRGTDGQWLSGKTAIVQDLGDFFRNRKPPGPQSRPGPIQARRTTTLYYLGCGPLRPQRAAKAGQV
jgi:hypothetical protein